MLQLDARRTGSAQAASDRVTVSVGATTPPIGAPINTLGDAGAITIADQSYGGSADASRLAYVVIERTTRAKVEADSVPADATGIAKLAQLADTYGRGDNALAYLMVISGRSGIPGDLRGSFSGVAKSIGADVFSEEQFKDLAAGRQFSVVGIPGAAPGRGDGADLEQRTGLRRDHRLPAEEPGARLRRQPSLRIRLDRAARIRHEDRCLGRGPEHDEVGSQTYVGRLAYRGSRRLPRRHRSTR